MHWQVKAELVGHDGEAVWGYARSEVVPPPRPSASEEEVTQGFLNVGQKLLDSIDEAKVVISECIRGEGVEP